MSEQQDTSANEALMEQIERFIPKEYQGRIPFIIPAGFTKFVSQELQDEFLIWEVDPTTPIMSQIMYMPTSKGVHIQAPEQWPDNLRNHFLVTVHQAYMSLCQSRITYGSLFIKWAYNALHNATAMLKAKPVTQHKKRNSEKLAIICGMGPSLIPTLESVNLQAHLQEAALFTCWHGADSVDPYMTPDYVAHCDAESLDEARHPGRRKPHEFPLDTKLIASPQCSPAFLADLKKGQEVLGYFGQDFQLNSFFAEKHGIGDHKAIHCTVISMMINSAIYMGFKKIALVGVDNAWTSKKHQYENAIPHTVTQVVNSHKKKLYTYPTFEVAVTGLSEIAVLNKEDVQIYQTSKNALDIVNVEYKPLIEVLSDVKNHAGSSQQSARKNRATVK